MRFDQYGGRGIEFRFADMAEFIACIGPRPSAQHSLDRIESDGHYEVGNVRWALPEVQTLNKQNTRVIESDGESKPLKEWCEHFGQPYRRVWERIKDGWDAKRALTEPAGPTARRYAETYVQVEALPLTDRQLRDLIVGGGAE